MDFVLVAPFGFAIAIVTLLFVHSRQLCRAAVRSDAQLRRAKPSSH